MRIGIQTWGSDGDVRPFIALAAGLKSAGHDVSLAVSHAENRDFTDFSRALDLPIRSVGMLDPSILSSTDEMLRKARNPITQLKVVMQCLYEPFAAAMGEAAKDLCQENDVVIGHFMVHQLKTAAEVHSTPCMSVFTAPILPTSTLAPGGIILPLPALNRLVWKIADAVLARTYLPVVNAMRTAEGLRPLKSTLGDVFLSTVLNLVEVSPVLFPAPPDWDGRVSVCGSFNLQEPVGQWQMPGPLQRFLDSGPPPVYMTFGSMSAGGKTFDEGLELLAEGAQRAGVRAIIQTGEQRAVPAATPDLFYLSRAPHHRVFPQCVAVVHHGGAGTSHSASRAGLPSIVVEHVMDQAFWGATLFRAGIAPPMLHRRTLTAGRLARAIRTVLDSSTMQEKARQVGELMGREDGVRRAVALIEERLGDVVAPFA